MVMYYTWLINIYYDGHLFNCKMPMIMEYGTQN